MPFGEGYRPKPPEELFKQLETTQDVLGQDAEHSLVPESQDKEKILQMSEAELKQKFTRRYEMYLQLLRDQKRQEKTGESNLPPEDIEEMKKWLGILNSLDTYIKKHHKGEDVTLRGKQIDVFDSMRNFLEEGGSEGYVKLPTGVGKTVLFTELIEAMDVKTLIVVPTKILVEQTAEKLEEFAPDLEFGKVYSYAKEHGRQVTIITYDSLVSQLEKGQINPEDFDCLILDEVHESLSDKRQEAVGKFGKAIKLGFTATPKFSEKKQVSNLLEKEIHSMTIREAVEAGMLCSVSSIIVRTEADVSNVKVKDSGEYDEKELEKAVNIASRNKAAVDLYKKVYDGQLAVAYCVGIDHAVAVAKEFNEAGVSAAYISGKTPKKEQKEILKKFHNGEIKVLCNADLLIAGFDEPKASVCLNLRPTQSRIDAEQRGGRVLRLDKTKSKKLATVVDFLDKNYSIDKPPVLFADVAEGANFYSGRDDERPGGGGRGGDGGEAPVIIDVEGVEVIYDSEEVMKIVKQIIEERDKDQKENQPKTQEGALAELEEAFAKWQAQPEETRGRFNTEWLIKNGYEDLYKWSRRSKSLPISELVERSKKEELKKNFEIQKSKKRTLESALLELEEAFAKWQAQPEETRGIFNTNWLTNNGYLSLYDWSTDHISLSNLLLRSNNSALKDNFKFKPKKRNKFSLESALTELEQAFAKWQALPEKDRGDFNGTWLKRNGYSSLNSWASDNISLSDLVSKSANDVMLQSFKKRELIESVKRTPESALTELEQAFAKWQALPGSARLNFDYVWLKNNGFRNLVSWTDRNTSLLNLVNRSGNKDLIKKFINKEKEVIIKRTTETAIKELEQAFAKWQALPEKDRGDFNVSWLRKSGYGPLYDWSLDNVSIESLAENSKVEELNKYIADQAKSKKPEEVERLYIKELEQAFAKWQALPEKDRGDFNGRWLSINGYNQICWWANKNGSIKDFVEKSQNKELKENFKFLEKRKGLNLDNYLQELEQAFLKWQTLPQEIRGKFNREWLKDNGFYLLCVWVGRQPFSFKDFVEKSQNKELKENFESRKKM